MCEFCHQHGEGKKWYLQAKNYANDMLSDVQRRRIIADLLGTPEKLQRDLAGMAKLDMLPGFVRRAIGGAVTRHAKKTHFGQVLPLEDVKEIFGFVSHISRSPCICRHVTLGEEARYCYGIALDPTGPTIGDILGELDNSYSSGPDFAGGELLSPDEAIAAFAEHEKEGLCHSVWTFKTPFIGGICNCDRVGCLALKATVDYGVKVAFRAEYVAEADPDVCTGCRSCMRVCPFGAILYNPTDKKIAIEPHTCYGCGICRSMCAKDAISLKPRLEDPVAARLW